MSPHADNNDGPRNGTSSVTKNGSQTSATAKYHSTSTQSAIAAEHEFAAHNYHPLPVVFARAQGVHVWDPEGNHYLDFLSAYSAVNQGHCHPALVQALSEQASRLTLSSRAFHNDVFPVWAEKVRNVFGYDMVLPMNTGAEAVETAIKVARKWAYKVKKVPAGKALVFSVDGNFHGRTMTAVSLSVDPESRDNYGPYVPGIGAVDPETKKEIRYGNVDDLREVLNKYGKETAAFIVEPIQGEAGVVVPDDSYLKEVAALCKEHNVLLICDEIQTGIARTGRMLCCEWSGIKPDLVTLGKAISGGMYPVSCVLGSKEVMGVIEPGTHGSTYGGNPLGCAVSIKALELVEEEGLVEKAEKLGEIFREGVKGFKSPLVQAVRGKGLLNAVVIDESKTAGRTAWDLCLLLKEKGVLAKPTHGNIIRFAPPLVITEEELRSALKTIGEALAELPTAKQDESEH
ncbi:pyridoxal phosphate-dependent transferase [Podospora australis]|uniref:Ornithine aminotransferase n=1 Tax=Podospora australis TaxID=1536484 RepID=A0AAN7APF9_9PEZI|nr:pyridoxal phosphate-dependent transferase [Podospora australis]